MAQWLGIHLLMQGTRVQYMVQEDPTCFGATGPAQAQLLKPTSPRTHAPQQEKALLWKAYTPQREQPHSLQLEKLHVQQ